MRKRVEMTLYNQDVKERFLKEKLEKASQTTYRKSLYRIGKMETAFGKDLYDFTLNQVKATLLGMERKSVNSVIREISIVKSYQRWAYDNSYTKKVPIARQLTKEDLMSLMNEPAVKSQYFSDIEELYAVMYKCNSAQDAVIIGLLFSSIRGRADSNNTFEEIINLQKHDVDFLARTIIVRRNDGTTRIIYNVDIQILKVIQEAIEQEYYYFDNRIESDGDLRRKLTESYYVVRPIQRNDLPTGKINVTTINNRISKIAKRIAKPINPRTIFQSGMLNRAKMIEQEKGELNTEDYKKICEDFGLNPLRWFKLKEAYEYWKK